jgi:hypothetical protein
MEGLAMGSVCSSFVCNSGERRKAERVERVENMGAHIALTSTLPYHLYAPKSMLSPAISLVDGYHTTPFALAAKGVSQILSVVGSVDQLFLSVRAIRDWFLRSVKECGVDYVNDLDLSMKLEWHTHASRLGVDLDPPGLDHLLLPSLCKEFTLNSDNHYNPHGIPGNMNSDSKDSVASNLGLIRSQNLMHKFGGGGGFVNYKNYKNFRKFTKNLVTDKLSVKIILKTSFYFMFFDSVISMVLYQVAISLHALHFCHYFLL